MRTQTEIIDAEFLLILMQRVNWRGGGGKAEGSHWVSNTLHQPWIGIDVLIMFYEGPSQVSDVAVGETYTDLIP
jgi:hypothetical protein